MPSERSGAVFSNIVTTVLRNASQNAYEFKLTLYGPNLPMDINIHSDFIEQFVIDQQFLKNFASDCTISFKVTGWEYVTLLRGYQDLKATLILNEVHYIYGYSLPNREPIVFDFLAVIENAENILKELPVAQILPQPTDDNDTRTKKESIQLTLHVQLMEQKVYDLRHPKINCILKDTTVEQAIDYIAECFDIDDIKVAPLDNTITIQNLVIPPFQSFAQVLQTIQKEYGVYSKDISYFFMNNTLYIYPTTETEISFYDSITINVYKIAPNDLLGLEGYAAKGDGQFHIVTVDASTDVSASDKAKENQGDSVLVLDATKVVNDLKTSDSVNTEIKEGALQHISIDNSRNITSTGQNVTYGGVVTNPLNTTRNLGAGQLDAISASWAIANLNNILPKNPVVYHYVNKDGYQIQQGSIGAVTYIFRKSAKPGNFIYRCDAGIFLMLTPLEND
jgi:hypothetical protein